jgi:GT2 family glycosyltransferase
VLTACLDSVVAQTVRGGHETIVVDNASTDGTAAVLNRYADRVRVITNDHNAGYSGANNLAAREAGGEVLFFLNSDTELLAPDVLERLATTAMAEGVGIAGPMLLNPDGTLQPSCAPFPTVRGAALVGLGLQRLIPDRVLARVAPQFWSHDRAIDSDWLMGAALAMRAKVFHELGGFWPLLYAEEAELAYRARRRGLRVRFEPSARVMHVGNHSLSQRLSDAERAERVASAELTFLETHYAPARATAIRAIAGSGYAVRALVHGLLRRRDKARVYRSMARVYAGRGT